MNTLEIWFTGVTAGIVLSFLLTVVLIKKAKKLPDDDRDF